MTPARAKEVLEGMGLDEFDEFILKGKNVYIEHKHMFIDPKHSFFSLHDDTGSVSAEELEAIALWMRDPEGVTNA